MALTTTQVQQLSDSVSQAISDFNTNFVTGTASATTTITTGVSGTGASQTLGRALLLNDLTPELNLLRPANTVAGNVTAYLTGLRALTGFYAQYYPLFDALDNTAAVAAVLGLNNFLTSNTIQVNAWFATAFNTYVTNAIALGYRTSATVPAALVAANFYPYSLLDTMWTFTTGTATTMTSSAIGGTNTSTAIAGGGVAQFYLYKSNAGNAAGSATLTITYVKADGTNGTATYSTTSGVPLGSGSLAAGYTITGAIGSAIVSVTGTGMTAAENYVIGQKLIRATSY